MRRTVSAAALLLLVVAAATTGCGNVRSGQHAGDVEIELTVTGPAARRITYSFVTLSPDRQRVPFQAEVAAPTMPWTYRGVAQPGETRVEVDATGGPASCTITVDRERRSRTRGPAPMECVALVKPS